MLRQFDVLLLRATNSIICRLPFASGTSLPSLTRKTWPVR